MPASTPQSSKVTLDRALAVHRAWKATLLKAVQSDAVLDVQTLQRDDCCDLGQWLHAEGRQQYGHTPQFVALLRTHKEFHLVTGMVATVINDKNYEQAKTLLQTGSQFEAASTDVALAIMNLKSTIAALCA